MEKMAATDPAIAARLKLFQHGVPEEFYDYENDPDALNNLIDDPAYASQLAEHRAAMRRFMEQSGDPMLPTFDARDNPSAVSAYVDRVQAESDARRAARRKSGNRRAAGKNNAKLFQIELPREAVAGGKFKVWVDHKLPGRLQQQDFHVTLKDADGQRIERIVSRASGTGRFSVQFKLPADLQTAQVSVAVFVGKDFANSLAHRSAGPVAVSK